MPLVNEINYVKEPTSLQCGQAVLAMLSGESVEKITEICGTDRETTLKSMFSSLDCLSIKYKKTRGEVKTKEELPKRCILSLETPRCWHWSLYFDGVFYDPEHGIMTGFPECKRKYFFEII